MTETPIRFNLKAETFKQRTERINKVFRQFSLIAATGSIVEAHLMSRLAISGGLPNLAGCGTNSREVIQLCDSEQKIMLIITESISQDHGQELIAQVRIRNNSLIRVLYVLQDAALAGRVEKCGADAVVMATSFGTGVVAKALSELQAGRGYRDPAFCRLLSQQHLISLTKREQQVLQLLQLGMTNKDIAANLSVAAVTIRDYIRNLMNKLNASNRTMVVIHAKKAGLI